MKKKIIVILTLCFVLSSCDKVRQYTRQGNSRYKDKEYNKAIDSYKNALKADSTFAKTNYNLANAYMQDKSQNYNQAINHYDRFLSQKIGKSRKDTLNFAKGLYNRGNAFFNLSQQNKDDTNSMKYLAQAAQDYKNAMILNKKDSDAKYNYAMCLWLMKSNNQPQNNNNNNQNNQNNSDIDQMLQAMKNNEKQTISRVKKNEDKTKNQRNEKDW